MAQKTVAHKVAVVCASLEVLSPHNGYTREIRGWEIAIWVLCGFSSRFQPLGIRSFVLVVVVVSSHFDEVSTLHLVHYYHWQLAFYHTLVGALPLHTFGMCICICQCQWDKTEKIYWLTFIVQPNCAMAFFPYSIAIHECFFFLILFVCLFGSWLPTFAKHTG